MPYQIKRSSFSTLLFFATLLFSCAGDGNGSTDCGAGFDQEAMFANLADHLIIPGYTELSSSLTQLNEDLQVLQEEPTEESVGLLREQFKRCYIDWQWVAAFEFGPGENQLLRSTCNNFPVNIDLVEQNLSEEHFDEAASDRFDRGFPALDYLLFHQQPEWILEQMQTHSFYTVYLESIIQQMLSNVEHSLEAWNTGYRNSFIENTGTAAGSSLSAVINQLSQQYERIKTERIGLPSGELSLQFAFPEKVEAYFSGISKELAVESLEALRAFYEGKSRAGSDGPGLEEFLQHVDAQKNEQSLDQAIKDQFSTALQAVEALNSPLSTSIENENETVVNAYNEISRQVIHLKTDMPAVLCVSITYIDNPSDSD